LWIASGERITSVTIVAGADGRVIHHTAEGIEATRSRTGILAALIDAGQGGGTFGVDGTLWSTVGCPAHEIGQAGAHTRLTHNTALGVASAGTGNTGILIGLGLLRLLLPRRTAYKRIAAVAGWAGADRVVVGHLADGLVATIARTRVYTALVYARPVLSTLGANRALWTTGGRSANVVGNAGADRMAVHLTALAIRTAGRWTAWFNGSGH